MQRKKSVNKIVKVIVIVQTLPIDITACIMSEVIKDFLKLDCSIVVHHEYMKSFGAENILITTTKDYEMSSA